MNGTPWQQQLDKHKDKIKYPDRYDVDWDSKDDTWKAGLLKHWTKEIRIFESNIKEATEELKKRGDY